jgi:hypothetical protein
MLPRLGDKYDIEIEVTAKPKADYLTDDYFALDLPVAPAIMVGDEIVVEGADIGVEKVEEVICRCLGLPPPEPPQKGVMARIFGR